MCSTEPGSQAGCILFFHTVAGDVVLHACKRIIRTRRFPPGRRWMRISFFFLCLVCVSLCFLPVLFTRFGWSYARAQAPAFGTELWHLASFLMKNIPKTGCLGVNPAPRTAILHLVLHLKMPGNKGGSHDGCRNVGFFTKTYFGEGLQEGCSGMSKHRTSLG